MPTSEQILGYLTAFHQAREAALHADSSDLGHHLIEFVAELQRNPMCQEILASVPPFDGASWWKEQTDDDGHVNHHLGALRLPGDPDAKLAALWYLMSAMGSDAPDDLDFRSFGYAFHVYKVAEAASKAISLVVQPFSNAMTDRLRVKAAMANPNLRELAGVPLAAIPQEGETRIFLSHRSADKELVRPYFELLRALGHDPWLDEPDMPAGTTLHRGITAGMDSSCAVVFFVTPNFEDDRWLAREVDQAVHRKVERAERFAIITLVFDGAEVPRALREYVWVNVSREADAIRKIVEALPIELGGARWKRAVYAPHI